MISANAGSDLSAIQHNTRVQENNYEKYNWERFWLPQSRLTLSCGSSDVCASKKIVHDPEFVLMEKEYGKQWKADEAQIRIKLASLEAKLGKKPNIVYIMADDVGYTERVLISLTICLSFLIAWRVFLPGDTVF